MGIAGGMVTGSRHPTGSAHCFQAAFVSYVTCTNTHLHTHTHTRAHKYTYTDVLLNAYTCAHTKHAYAHTRTHAHPQNTHTQIHTLAHSPNGAGKTTSINMLTGLLEPSGGDAIIAGYSIRTDMHKIHTMMGVCPQHDLTW